MAWTGSREPDEALGKLDFRGLRACVETSRAVIRTRRTAPRSLLLTLDVFQGLLGALFGEVCKTRADQGSLELARDVSFLVSQIERGGTGDGGAGDTVNSGGTGRA